MRDDEAPVRLHEGVVFEENWKWSGLPVSAGFNALLQTPEPVASSGTQYNSASSLWHTCTHQCLGISFFLHLFVYED